MYRFFTKECLNIGRRLHAWRARLILVQTKHSSGTTDTLKSTIKLLLFFPAWYHKGIYKIKDLISDNGKFLPFDVFCRMFDVKACFTTHYGRCNSIRQNWNAISKESHGVLELISNWRTNNSNLTTADLLRVIADSKFVPPSAEQFRCI